MSLTNKIISILVISTIIVLLTYFFIIKPMNEKSKSMSESEAKAISKQIANLLETNSTEATKQATALTTQLLNAGWKYIDYGVVSPTNPTAHGS